MRASHEQRFAKVSTDLKGAYKKIEIKEREILIKNKEIGKLEIRLETDQTKFKNQSHQLKKGSFDAQRVDSTRVYSKNLLEHETRKKDAEISKLRELIGKKGMTGRDKIEVSHNFARYELNNFYDSPQADCGSLMSKDQENMDFLVQENHLIRDTVLRFYGIAWQTLQRHCGGPYPMMLNKDIFQKPFSAIYQEVEMAF
jgi:hypothetical protein